MALNGKITTKTMTEAQRASKQMTEAQRAYERKRAEKAGKSLEGWLDDKRKRQEAEVKTVAPPPTKKPGLLSRWIDRAHKPLKG